MSFLGFLSLNLTACTDSGKIESLSLEEASRLMAAENALLANENIIGRDELKREFLAHVNGATTYKVQELNKDSTKAQVVIQATGLPKSVRLHLAKIVGTVDAWKVARFNFQDAVLQIYSQTGKNFNEKEVHLIKVNLTNVSGWKVLKP